VYISSANQTIPSNLFNLKLHYCENSRLLLLLLAILMSVLTRQIHLGTASYFNNSDEISINLMSKDESGAL
jgi:hypothetical protein